MKKHLREQDQKLRALQFRRFQLVGLLCALDDGDPQPYIDIIKRDIKRDIEGPFRSAAVHALGRIVKKHPSAIDELIELLPDTDVINALIGLGPLAKKAFPKLQELRKQDPESHELAVAAWMVSGSPTDAIEQIRRWSELNENEKLRSRPRIVEEAVIFLSGFADSEEVQKAVQEFSNSDSQHLQTMAAQIQKRIQSRKRM